MSSQVHTVQKDPFSCNQSTETKVFNVKMRDDDYREDGEFRNDLQRHRQDAANPTAGTDITSLDDDGEQRASAISSNNSRKSGVASSSHLEADIEKGGTTTASASNTSPGLVHVEQSLRVPGSTDFDPESHACSNNLESQALSGTNVCATNATRRASRRGSSLEMRKLPVNILLQPKVDPSYDDHLSLDEERYVREEEGRSGLLQTTCLNSNFNLRTQMMLSFGIISAFTIFLVLIVCVVITLTSSDLVKGKTRENYEALAYSLDGRMARYIAEDLTPKLILNDVVQIIYEATRDRFAGYPQAEDDSRVPFLDILSQTNRYPIVGESLPLDWQIVGNVNGDNYEEHVQGRWPWYKEYPKVSTANAFFAIQGACDPTVTDETNYAYIPGCSDANNNLTTGGIYAPSRTTEQIHRKASDLAPLLKALYEFHQDVKYIGIYFSNSGAGASMAYPGTPFDTNTRYTSIGCDWAKAPNPYNQSRQILSNEAIVRCRADNRHIYGAEVSTRLYTPTDRGWCRDLALQPEKTMTVGPYLDAWKKNSWLMTVGRAVYDRITNEFVSCIGVDFLVDSVVDILMESRITNHTQITVIQFDETGTVVASTAWNMSSALVTVRITEIDVGVSPAAYKSLQQLVNYSNVWDPVTVREIYENYTVWSDGYRVKAYPMPPPPKNYDKNYQPAFLAIVSLSQRDMLEQVEKVEKKVSEEADRVILLSIVVGCIAFGIMIAVLYLVSYTITLPLTRMNDIARSIIDNFGGNEKKIEVDDPRTRGFMKTELSEIVLQFQKMVQKFSGGAIAKSAEIDILELDNQFQMFEEFKSLYLSRQEKDFKYNIEEPQTKDDDDALARVHFGSNVNAEGNSSHRDSVHTSELLKDSGSKGCSSPLFQWITVLIVLPLLLSTLTISVFVITSVSQRLPHMVKDAERGFLDLQDRALLTFSKLRAGLVSKRSEQSIRDLHILTRYSSWLLFDGIKMNDAYPEVHTGTEACKYSPELVECEYAIDHYVCDCEWNDDSMVLSSSSRRVLQSVSPDVWQCREYETDSRYMQVPVFFSSSQDTWPNGDKNSTSYPLVADKPSTTAWWENSTAVPGANRNASLPHYGYRTTYDRLRSVAALPILQVLYNYDIKKEVVLNSFVSYEADGMHYGYRGCSNILNAAASRWVSSKENGAAELQPDLCPLGKFGYDPRCREWYDTGKNLSGSSSLYVTSPYLFANSKVVAQSCTSPLVDPNTNEYVGQTLIDFVSTAIIDSLNAKNTPLAEGGFAILITLKRGASLADTVIGPNFSGIVNESKPIEKVIFPFSNDCFGSNCGGLDEFTDILSHMRAGGSGRREFSMVSASGSVEKMHIAFHPVDVKRLRPVNSSDFSRGIENSKYVIYSLALTETESALLEPFKETESEIRRQIRVAIAILSIVIVFSACFVLFFSHHITVSLTEPMYYLLELIKHTNRLEVGIDSPVIYVYRGYGSSEVLRVRWTMEKLYKIIQCANAAYFSGEVEVAYRVFTDALHLFTRLDNKKAMGVANSNLGNTMLTLYRTMKNTGQDHVCGLSEREIIGEGMAYFHQAIQLGEKAYDEFYETEGWSPSCLNFMQHLSNRYFNRAMFLLTIKDGHEKPKEVEELGMRDLQIANDMDIEIVAEGTQVGWGIRSSRAHFEVLITRIRGHLTVLEMGRPVDDSDVNEMLEDAFKLVQTELKSGSCDLFQDLGPAGRMQQLETELMRYNIVKEDLPTAARIAIRMLVEDEFTIPEAQNKAIEVLLQYVGSTQPEDSTIKDRLIDYQQWLEEACEELDTCRPSVQGLDKERLSAMVGSEALRASFSGHLDPVSKMRQTSIRHVMRGDLTMESF